MGPSIDRVSIEVCAVIKIDYSRGLRKSGLMVTKGAQYPFLTNV